MSAAPLTVEMDADAAPVTIAADDTSVIGECPFDGTITGVTYTAKAAVTGANTNSRTISVVNKGQAGAGAVVAATLPLVSGANAVAFDETAIPLSGTPANLTVASGDVLAFTSTHVGTGIVDPGGRVKVTISRTAGA